MSFLSALDRIRRWHRLGRLAAAVLAGLAVAGTLALLLGLADTWSGFEPGPRQALVGLGLTIAAGFTAVAAVVALRLSRERAAALADRRAADPRGRASAALSLSRRKTESPLEGYLTARSLEETGASLRTLPGKSLVPWQMIGRAAMLLAACLLPIGLLAMTRPVAFAVVAHRLTHPSQDLPPWSPLDFVIDPAQPQCLYGGDLALTAEITGGELEFPVECLVRVEGSSGVQRLPAFRESATRFTRTLEGVTEPISIAFACGRARSGWLPVERLLQPKVLAGRVTIAPPSYIGNEAVTTPLDSNQISALEGSTLTLELTSNRPLAASDLVFTSAATPGSPPRAEMIRGEVIGTETIAFRWTVASSGTLSAALRDVRGTPAEAPLQLALRAVPDQPPAVDLSSPPRLLLATPRTRIPLTGRAEDDFGLSRVQFVRTLQGFRDRARVVAPSLRETQYQFDEALDLGQVGVEPGQTIELFLEASDHNPSMLGQGASEISRIRIISESDYAERIRAKTTLGEFNARFRAISEALREARRTLEELKQKGDPEALKKAIDQHRRATGLMDQLAQDFPAFATDERLKQAAAGNAARLRENLSALEAFKPGMAAGERARQIDEMLERLGAGREAIAPLKRDAELLAEAGGVLEMAAKFRQIHANQVSVAERIHTLAKEIARGNDTNRRQLPSLGETQRKNREALGRFAEELSRRAGAMERPELAPLRESALDFIQRLKLADPASVMDLASESARDGQANDAFVSAELARGMLESLMSPENAFCQACRGSIPENFPVPMDVHSTMRQLLAGLMCQNPGMSPNQGTGGGGFGMGGTGPTGHAQPGFGMLDIPVVGPERMFFQPASMAAESRGTGEGAPSRPLELSAETESLAPTETPRASEARPDFDAVPEAYREAVKTYFTPEN
ncbi:hypothetical protein [Haloferula sargassicola]|uniref:DUF4175 domain-containing protein n=1 Tax=Haloferula sargassicola TaxID=490096 RepID=A0ABP9UK49_9BACT